MELECNFNIKIIDAVGNSMKIEIAPLPQGLGTTIGNSLRRVLLSSIPGYAIYGIIINGVYHPFSTIKGVVQDVLDIIQNLKKVRFKPVNASPLKSYNYSIAISGKTAFKAGDLASKITEFEIVNPELIICEMEPDVSLKMELFIDCGKGFALADENRSKSSAIGFMPIDSIYTPVLRANFKVEDISRTQFERKEKLILEVETDGSISPISALQYATKFLIDNFQMIHTFCMQTDKSFPFATLQKKEIPTDTIAVPEVSSTPSEEPKKNILDRSVKYLGFSTRTQNRLELIGVRTVGDLIKKTEEELKEVRGVGRMVIQEIKDVLSKYGLSLAQHKEEEK